MGLCHSITVRSCYRSSKGSRMQIWFTSSSPLSSFIPTFCSSSLHFEINFWFLANRSFFFLTLWYLPTEDKTGKVWQRGDTKEQLTLFFHQTTEFCINVRNTKTADKEQTFLAKETCSLTFGSYMHFLLFMLLLLNITCSLLHIT